MHFVEKEPSQKRLDFDTKLKSNKILRIPGAYNPLTAKVIEEIGYDGVYVSGGVMYNDLGYPDIGLKTLNDVLHKFVDEKKISGIQTAIFRKGNLVHSDTYGYSDIETKKPLKENSIYRLASMTKPIVSVALMMLHEEGKFHLDDPLEKYIPWFKSSTIMDSSGEIYPAVNKIRIIDLLRHTSGIGSDGGIGYINSLYRDINRKEQSNNETLVKKISGLPLYFEPGTKWKYGLSTTVCGYLIEVLSKKHLDEFLKK